MLEEILLFIEALQFALEVDYFVFKASSLQRFPKVFTMYSGSLLGFQFGVTYLSSSSFSKGVV